MLRAAERGTRAQHARYRRRISGRLPAPLGPHRGILRTDSPRLEFAGHAVRVIAEPGRYIAAPAAVAVSSVMGRAMRDGRWWYYLDDGLYGSYSGQMFDHATYPVEALVTAGPTYPSVLAGPTCDSIDVIDETLELPKLEHRRSHRRPGDGRLHLGIALRNSIFSRAPRYWRSTAAGCCATAS